MSEHLLTAAEEKVAIRGFSEAAELQIKEGDKIYLLCFRWWKQWAAYVSEEVVEPLTTHNSKLCSKAEPFSGRPTSIDNSHLVNRSTIDDYAMELELKEALKENYDYILLPEQVWMAFHKWYGGGPVIARQVINTGSVCEDSLEVEIYPLRLCLIASPSRNRLITRMSRMATVGELYQKACDLFDLGSEQIRIWDYNGGRKNFLLPDLQQALADLKLQMDHDILLEVQVNGRWPDDHESFGRDHGCLMNDLPLVAVEPSRSSFSIADGPTGSRNFISSSPELVDSHSLSYSSKSLDGGLGCFSSGGARPGPLGLTGLQNLGNTCFMSSAIQCLAHTPQLVDFFVQDYSQEINQQNPLGMEGELAMAFGDLLRKLWADGRTPVAPRAFKAKLARFAPQFSGYNQHDSQELLAFLLDGLHEDLNRVKLKPYIESKNIDGRSDDEVAREYWDNHKARNDSIIVDTYQGQYKSTLVCPLCNKVSVTFDPFMYLSLPLPSATTRTITVTIFSSDGISPPTPCTVTVSRHARCKDVIHALSKACHLHNDERLLLMELYNPRSYRFLDEFMEWLSTIHDDAHLTAYRLAKSLEKAPLLIFINRRFEKDVTLFQDDQQLKYFGAPLFASLPDEGLHTGADLLMIFERLLGPLTKNQQSLITKHNEKELQNGMTNYIDDIMEVINKEETSVSNGTLKSIILNLQKSTPDGSNGPLEHCEELFQLFLTEEKGLTKESLIVVEKPLPPAFGSYRVNSKLHVTVEWSKKALEIYDIKQLEALPEVHKSGFPSKKVRQETVSLYACLEAFLKEEPLGPEDMWYCPCCKQHRQASKKLDLWRLPAILVVHLKRFSYSRFSKNKLETFVEFPIHDLDLTNYIACKDDPQSYVYELYAVSNHYGNMGGGHYTAYAKLIDDNRWYNFDDSHVSPVSEDEIKTAAAYVLFYRRTRTGNSSLSAGGPCWSSTRILETRNDEAG